MRPTSPVFLRPAAVNPDARRKPNLQKQATACAYTGQGTMSLAGAGQRPRNYCRKTSGAAASEPRKTNHGLCFIAVRQSPPPGGTRTPTRASHSLRPYESRDNVPCGCRAEPAELLPTGNPRRQAEPEPSKASRPACAIADRHPPPQGGNRTHKSKPRLALLPPSGGHSPPGASSPHPL